jgi:hypothetical protein
MAIAALAFTAVSGTSQAAPIAPLPAVSTDNGGLTQVYWHHGYGWHRHCWWRHGYRVCA